MWLKMGVFGVLFWLWKLSKDCPSFFLIKLYLVGFHTNDYPGFYTFKKEIFLSKISIQNSCLFGQGQLAPPQPLPGIFYHTRLLSQGLISSLLHLAPGGLEFLWCAIFFLNR